MADWQSVIALAGLLLRVWVQGKRERERGEHSSTRDKWDIIRATNGGEGRQNHVCVPKMGKITILDHFISDIWSFSVCKRSKILDHIGSDLPYLWCVLSLFGSFASFLRSDDSAWRVQAEIDIFYWCLSSPIVSSLGTGYPTTSLQDAVTIKPYVKKYRSTKDCTVSWLCMWTCQRRISCV